MTRKNRKNGFDLIGLEIEQERTRCRERMKKEHATRKDPLS